MKSNIISFKRAMSRRAPNPACVIFILAVLSAGNTCFGFDDEGFQYWSTTKASLDLDKDWKLGYEEEFRLGDDGGNLYYHHSDLGLVYKGLSRSIDLGVNYKQIKEKDGKDKWRPEYRPHFNVTLKNKLFGLDVSDRSRFEHRARETSKDIWRYRNKLSIELPFEFAALKLQPYLADEVFFDMNDKVTTRTGCIRGSPLNYRKIPQVTSTISGRQRGPAASGRTFPYWEQSWYFTFSRPQEDAQ